MTVEEYKRLFMSKKKLETDGMHNGNIIYCPACDFECPYCDTHGVCRIADPIEDCDEFVSYFESWEDWEES